MHMCQRRPDLNRPIYVAHSGLIRAHMSSRHNNENDTPDRRFKEPYKSFSRSASREATNERGNVRVFKRLFWLSWPDAIKMKFLLRSSVPCVLKLYAARTVDCSISMLFVREAVFAIARA